MRNSDSLYRTCQRFLRIALRVGRGRNAPKQEYSLPINEADLEAARKGYRVWAKGQGAQNPLDGAWGTQIEYGFIRPNVPWFAQLKDFDRIIALHAIADRFCEIVDTLK